MAAIRDVFGKLQNFGFAAALAVKATPDECLRGQEQFLSCLARDGQQPPRALVWFRAAAVQGGRCPIEYRVPSGNPAATADTARLLLEVLTKSGLYAEWSGIPGEPIVVKEN